MYQLDFSIFNYKAYDHWGNTSQQPSTIAKSSGENKDRISLKDTLLTGSAFEFNIIITASPSVPPGCPNYRFQNRVKHYGISGQLEMFQLQWCWKWRYDRNARYGSYGSLYTLLQPNEQL
jgi:hypothetical protein